MTALSFLCFSKKIMKRCFYSKKNLVDIWAGPKKVGPSQEFVFYCNITGIPKPCGVKELKQVGKNDKI